MEKTRKSFKMSLSIDKMWLGCVASTLIGRCQSCHSSNALSYFLSSTIILEYGISQKLDPTYKNCIESFVKENVSRLILEISFFLRWHGFFDIAIKN